ncbi:MAG: DUF378 domain-containing protein [Candidatus Coproplasma sp.]
MIFINIVCYLLAIVGALNWGLVGIFDFNLVGWIFGGYRSVGAIIVYILVALAAIWLIISPMISGRGLILAGRKSKESENVTHVTAE